MCFGICYLLFCAAFIGIFIFGMAKGQFSGAYAFHDGLTGERCTGTYKYLFIQDYSSVETAFSQSICVSKCPAKGDALDYNTTAVTTPPAKATYGTKIYTSAITVCIPTDAGAATKDAF